MLFRSLFKRFNKSLDFELKIEYLNCKLKKVADTEYRILAELIKQLGGKVPATGLPTQAVYNKFLEIIDKKKQLVILVLDEIDQTTKKISDNFLYNLTRLNSELNNTQIIIVGISNDLRFLDGLDPRVRSSLGEEELVFPPYNAIQLQEILKERAEGSFKSGVVSEGVIAKCAAFAAREHGDARRALELMWYAGKHADKENSSLVYPDHVRLAKADIEPSIIRQAIKELSKHKLMLLLGIARQLLYTHAAYITTGNAEISYHIICEEYEINPRKHTQVWEYLKEFENIGILSMKKSGIGQRGKTKHISIQDVSALELEKEVLKRIQELLPKSMLVK